MIKKKNKKLTLFGKKVKISNEAYELFEKLSEIIQLHEISMIGWAKNCYDDENDVYTCCSSYTDEGGTLNEYYIDSDPGEGNGYTLNAEDNVFDEANETLTASFSNTVVPTVHTFLSSVIPSPSQSVFT